MQLGLSQEDIALETDEHVSQRTVSALETGSTLLSSMAISRVIALARALNWSVAELQKATGVDLGSLSSNHVQENPSSASWRAEVLSNLLHQIGHSVADLQHGIGDRIPNLNEYLSGKRDLAELTAEQARALQIEVGLYDTTLVSALAIPRERQHLWRTDRPNPYDNNSTKTLKLKKPLIGTYAGPAESLVIYSPTDPTGVQLVEIGDNYYSMPSGTPGALGRILGVLPAGS